MLTLPMFAGSALAGDEERVLYSFEYAPDGANPEGNVVFDKAGNIYGTTPNGGSYVCVSGTCGTVFQLIPPKRHGDAWTESVLYSFKGKSHHDGNGPVGLIPDGSGNLYGTTLIRDAL